MTQDNFSHILDLLAHGELEVTDQFIWGSNYTYRATVQRGDETLVAVYKPSRGERPLWDFPDGTLAKREVAAYQTSEALGWALVPPTVLREDGPAGSGSLQLYVETDPELHYFSMTDEDRTRLRPAAVFDLLVNNADRKGGHVLLDSQDHLWLIDHGVCFHHQPKLRTVIWDFAGEPVPEPLLESVERFHRKLRADSDLIHCFEMLLLPQELRALRSRAQAMLQSRSFPHPGPGRPYPWPLV